MKVQWRRLPGWVRMPASARMGACATAIIPRPAKPSLYQHIMHASWQPNPVAPSIPSSPQPLPQFYAPWCGHCKALKPAWIDLARQLGGKVKVGAVDCTSDKATCDEFGVRGELDSGARL